MLIEIRVSLFIVQLLLSSICIDVSLSTFKHVSFLPILLFCFILQTHGGFDSDVYRDFQVWCHGFFWPLVPCAPSLYCPIANSASTKSQQSVYRMSNQIDPTYWLSNSTHSDSTWTASHPSTNRAQHCLTSMIATELIFPSWQAAVPFVHSLFSGLTHPAQSRPAIHISIH